MSRIPAHGARGFQWAQLLKAGSPHRFHATVQGFGDHAARQPIRQPAAHHLPPHNELAGVFGANGLDQIICRSVNDAFVMNEWKQDQAAGKPGIRSPHRSRQRRFLYGMLRHRPNTAKTVEDRVKKIPRYVRQRTDRGEPPRNSCMTVCKVFHTAPILTPIINGE